MVGAEVAKPRQPDGRWCSGDGLAGATRHDEACGCAQQLEGVEANSGLTKLAAE